MGPKHQATERKLVAAPDIKCSLSGLVCVMLATGCGVKQVSLADRDARSPDGSTIDAKPDAPSVDATLGVWSAPTKVTPASSVALQEDDASLSPNALEITFDVTANGFKQLFQATRPTTNGAWSAPTPLFITATVTFTDQTPRYASDGLTLYFGSTRPGGTGGEDIWKITRAATTSAWGRPVPVAEVNTTLNERWFAPCDDGSYLLIANRTAPTDLDVYEGKLGSGVPAVRSDVLSKVGYDETGTFVSFNCKHAFFTSVLHGLATFDIFESVRTGTSWTTPTPVTDINTPTFGEQDPWMSVDTKHMLFVSNVGGTLDVYEISRN
jgi:hypothetical protein